MRKFRLVYDFEENEEEDRREKDRTITHLNLELSEIEIMAIIRKLRNGNRPTAFGIRFLNFVAEALKKPAKKIIKDLPLYRL